MIGPIDEGGAGAQRGEPAEPNRADGAGLDGTAGQERGARSGRGRPARARRALAVVIVVAACVVAVIAVGARNGGAQGVHSYDIEFDNAFGLAAGGDLKIAGVRAGRTTGFDLVGQAHPRAIVHAEITEPGFGALHRDAHCEIRPQSLIGEYYVDCQPGTAAQRIPDGGRIPVAQTSSTIPVDLVGNIMRRPERDRLRLIVQELGAGLAGRPKDLAEVLRRAHPGLRETSEMLSVLGRQTDEIKRLIVNADTVVGALERRKRDVTRFVDRAGQTATVAASRRTALSRTFARMPEFLAELDPYMARLGELTRAQTPVLRNLQGASGDLDRFLVRLRPFAEQGQPALLALGDAAQTGSRAVHASKEEIAELRALAHDVPGLAKPLRQILETSDDRARAVENDPRAAETGPPAPDKTHIAPGKPGGFTGMEAIWDYFFWQALTTNAMDGTGKVLRLAAVVNECSNYSAKPSAALLAECNQFLGPTQPGVTTPDPTRTALAASPSAGAQRRANARRGKGDGKAPRPDDLGDLFGVPAPPVTGAPAPTPTPAPLPPSVPTAPVPLPSAPQVPTPQLPAPTPQPVPTSPKTGIPLLDYLLSP